MDGRHTALSLDKRQKIVITCRRWLAICAVQSAIAGLIDTIISKIDITPDSVTIVLDQKSLAAKLQIEALGRSAPPPSITVPVTLKRSGSALRMVLPSGESASPQVDDNLLTTIAIAKQWWRQMLSNPQLRVTDLAAMHQVTESWVARVLRLAFLDPAIITQMMAGTAPAALDFDALRGTECIPALWSASATCIRSASRAEPSDPTGHSVLKNLPLRERPKSAPKSTHSVQEREIGPPESRGTAPFAGWSGEMAEEGGLVGGGGGIRTHGTLARTTVFETVPIDHSGTPPRVGRGCAAPWSGGLNSRASCRAQARDQTGTTKYDGGRVRRAGEMEPRLMRVPGTGAGEVIRHGRRIRGRSSGRDAPGADVSGRRRQCLTCDV